MRFQLGRDLVQRALDLGAVVDAAALDAEAFEEFAAEGVGAENSPCR